MSDTPIRDCELEVDGNLLCIETDAVAKCYGEGDYELDDFATANAERIAACWNACRYVPTEYLKDLLKMARCEAEMMQNVYQGSSQEKWRPISLPQRKDVKSD